MRTHLHQPLGAPAKLRPLAGISLLECLVYIALLTVVMGVGFLALYYATDNYKGLYRNSDDIARAVNIGELWRKDIRAAVSAPQPGQTANGEELRIPQSHGDVIYRFNHGELSRQQNPTAPAVTLLPRVEASIMTQEARAQVTAWHWDLTLKTRARKVQLQPRFSFAAVPGKAVP